MPSRASPWIESVFSDFQDKELQARLDSWILSVADHRRVPALNGMTVADAFKKEQSLLLQITPERQKKRKLPKTWVKKPSRS